MSGNKRPLIGCRELQALVASRDAFLANRSPVEKDVVKPTGLTPLPSPHTSQTPTFINSRPTVGQLSLPAVNNPAAVIPKANRSSLVADDDMNFGVVSIRARHNVIENREAKEIREAWVRYQTRKANPIPDHGHHTRGAAGHRRALYLQQQELEDFNARFRALPAEVKEIIFGFAIGSIEGDGKKIPELIVGLRAIRNDPDQQLYKAALRAFCSQNTFVLTRKNSYTMDSESADAMLPVVWETIRNLEIKHEYMRPDDRGFYFLFVHRKPNVSYPFSPCTRCDFRTISLAKNVRKLHLNFGDSYHCIMGSIQAICRLAIEEMRYLERLVLTLSNIRCIHSNGDMARLINKINDATRETGRLLSVSSKVFSTGLHEEGFASESWLWQTTEPRSHLVWVDDWAKKIASDATAAEARFGQRRLTQAAATDSDDAEDASSEDSFSDIDPDEDDFDDFMPSPQ